MPVNANAFQQRLLATAMLSASALLLEIVLTRLFSLLYFPPYVFFIISIAILGIGLGAAVAAFRPELTQENQLALYSVGAAISTVALILVRGLRRFIESADFASCPRGSAIFFLRIGNLFLV